MFRKIDKLKTVFNKKTKLEDSQTFCVYPWIHQMATPTGKVNFCCFSSKTHITKNEGGSFYLGKESFQQAWNSEHMKDIRRTMANGKRVKGCEVCYKQDSLGERSYRKSHNLEWKEKLGAENFEKLLEDSKKNDFSLPSSPYYLDLRLGNLCNLKCRMCNPYNSSLLYKEWKDLDGEYDGGFSEFWAKYDMKNNTCSTWYESEVFWNSVEQMIPHLKKVYMTGGEPTLIKGNYRFLERCRELGYAKGIELFFNINFTNVKDRFVDSLNDFKWTSINASFDACGALNDYIRTGSKWSTCKDNFIKVAESGSLNIGLGITPVIQVYNILQIIEVLDFTEEIVLKYKRPVLVDFLNCSEPGFLDVIHLPDSIKRLAIERLENFRKRSKTLNDPAHDTSLMERSVNGLITRLKQSLGKENPEKIHDFIAYTVVLDKKRKQEFSLACPEVSLLLGEAGYDIKDQQSFIDPSHTEEPLA